METIIMIGCIVGFIGATLSLSLTTWRKNQKLSKNENVLKHEIENSRRVIRFLGNRASQQAIEPEFLASVGIPVLQEFNHHLADLYKKIFLLEHLAEMPQTVYGIGQYIKILNELADSKEKEYLLNNFSITLYSYKNVSYLIYNSLIINPEDNSDGQTVINLLLTNLKSIHPCSKINDITYTLTLIVNKRRSMIAKKEDDAITKRMLEVIKIMENCKS